MKNISSKNLIVDALIDIELKGNLIPEVWFKTILTANGKPDSIAIILLSEIVYWYRPKIITDVNTGEIIRLEKKFNEDLLQKSYTQLCEKFGYSEKQTRDAIVRLEQIGVIRRVFRTIILKGKRMNNVMYIELIPNKLKELTCVGDEDLQTLSTNLKGGAYEIVDRLSTKKETAVDKYVETNTKNTTQSTNIEYPIQSISEAREIFKGQIGYDALIIDHPFKSGVINELVEVAAELISSSKKTIKVAGEKRLVEDVKARYKQLNIHHMKYILESLENNTSDVKDIKSFLITTMFSAPATMDNHYVAKVNHDMKTA